MGRKSRFQSEALQYAYNRYVGRDKKKAEAFDAELANAEVARKLYDLRMQAGLTQAGSRSSWGPPHRSSAALRMPTTTATRSRCSGALPPG